MKTVEYRTPWKFLDDYRDEFEGDWPRIEKLFHINAGRFPDNQVFHSFEPEERYTYREAEERIIRIAGFLQSEGLRPGDKVGVAGKNSPQWVMAYFAVLYAGGIILPLDNNLKDDEMMGFLSFAGASMLFADKERAGSIRGIKTYSLEEGSSETWIMDMDGEFRDPGLRSSKDVASIIFTSGTTGNPKGVVLTHENLVSDCLLTQGNILITEKDVIYAILPLSHSYTMQAVVYMAISTGGSVVFGKKLAMSRILVELKEGKVTMFMAVPMLYNKMIAGLMAGVRKKSAVLYGIVRVMMGFSGLVRRVTGRNIGKKMFGFLLDKLSMRDIRICISGGGPLPVSTFRMFQELGIDFVQGYGLTEASPITHLNPIEAFRMESVGKKIAGTEVRIENPDKDGNGVVCIKGPMVMQGYYDNPEATAEVLSDGWLNTGDVGHQDDDGYLYLTGRAKSVIVTDGGKNVFPEEIEDKFQLCSEIAQLCVIGYMMDPKLRKEGIRIIIRFTDEYLGSIGHDTEEAERHASELVDKVNRELLGYKRITMITVTDKTLPMTSSSKVRRNEVRAMFGDI